MASRGEWTFLRERQLRADRHSEHSSGGVSVNGWANHFFDGGMPFGCVNGSGTGRYYSIHGFRELSHERPVYEMHAG
jgi:aldehyde dehydrogenase (NAD+)